MVLGQINTIFHDELNVKQLFKTTVQTSKQLFLSNSINYQHGSNTLLKGCSLIAALRILLLGVNWRTA